MYNRKTHQRFEYSVTPTAPVLSEVDDRDVHHRRATPLRTNIAHRSDDGCIVHEMKQTDTLASISLLYGVSKQSIRQKNNLLSENEIYSRKVLIIGGVKQDEDMCHREKIYNFVTKRHVTKEEATAYLMMNEWNLQRALESHFVDVVLEPAKR